ncbi:hypothetical protein EDB80DRAFT_576244 [Ilyonectria destructans]|nr:hypothetical protein EDB80DRAFT_576244 [Ilyonectria destructans]
MVRTADVDELIQDVKSIGDKDSNLKSSVDTVFKRSFEPHGKTHYTATVTMATRIPRSDLCKRLREVTKSLNLPYEYSHEFHGITPLYDNRKGADVDVVAVPGLASHALGSWMSPTRDEDEVWLRDFLPPDIPNIRVLAYGYDTRLVNSESTECIQQLGTRFLELITTFRDDDGTNRRPIIFLGHSLGGLIIKSALSYAHDTPQASESDLLKSCHAILFFGVPHQGMRSDPLDEIVKGQPNRGLIQELVVDNEDRMPSSYLNLLEAGFARTCRAKYEIVNFYELKQSSSPKRIGSGPVVMDGAKYLTVSRISATMGSSEWNNVALDTDHTGLVKFTSPADVNYTTVKGRLQKLVGEAEPEVAKRVAGRASNEGSNTPCT